MGVLLHNSVICLMMSLLFKRSIFFSNIISISLAGSQVSDCPNGYFQCSNNVSNCKLTVCPDRWVVYGSHCYRMYLELHSWSDAESKCQQVGGHLASIHNYNEHEFIFKLANNHTVWIGGSDEGNIKNWTWSDGTKWQYTNWNKNEPNNYNNEEECAEISDDYEGKWNDY